ncbi:MAG: hypothetical protein SNG27_07440 [Rikenellaceae bacterium]
MYKIYGIIAAIIVILPKSTLYSQSYIDHDNYIEVENIEDIKNLTKSENITPHMLFLEGDDYSLYDDILQYNNPPISTKRRGVEWWQYNRIYNTANSATQNVAEPTQFGELKLFSSNSTYRIGASGVWSTPFAKGWSQECSVVGRTGRDGSIDGVYEQSLYPTLGLTKLFSAQKYLTLSFRAPYTMRGLRSSATQECFDLVHNNLYNPSWGYYHGEVRNSRVMRNFLPEFNGRYQQPLFDDTTVAIDLNATLGTRRISRLGWYSSSNPTPNYYSKLPSYFYGSTSYDEVHNSWQQNDTNYTQVGWDKLELINLLSADGSAHYVVEDRVTRVVDVESKVLFNTKLTNNIEVDYGAQYIYLSHRKYKQMRDLLGADYLLDIDQYASDNSQTGNDLQNNLRNPNRKITQGDRFGYDFAQNRSLIETMGRVSYYNERVKFSLDATFGTQTSTRHGYYEKERFSGAGSYGDSQQIKFSTYNIASSVGYIFGERHRVEFSGEIDAEAPISSNLFIAEQNSNRIIESPSTEKTTSASLSYQFANGKFWFSTQAYIIEVSDLAQVWEGYDDLSSTYCNVVISDISTRSLGVDISARMRLSHAITLTSTLALVGAEYTSAPLVRLYDESDMSIVAESHASSLEGFVVGNTPQICATFGATLFSRKGFVVGLNVAYYGMRYIAPSIQRRTNRILSSATSSEVLTSILTQEKLSDMVDISLSLSKRISIGAREISLFIRVDNLLGRDDIVAYGYEGNRVLSRYSGGYSPQESSYQYCRGRGVYLSGSYRF